MNPPSQTVAVVPEAAQRVHGTTPPPCSLRITKSETALMERAAVLLCREAQHWEEGFVEEQPDGSVVWPKDSEWAHVRHFELTRTAARLRELRAKILSRANSSRQTPTASGGSLDGVVGRSTGLEKGNANG